MSTITRLSLGSALLAIAISAGLVTGAGSAPPPAQAETSRAAALPDRYSALEAAKRGGSRVEVWSLRTDRSTTYANPDGSLRTEYFSGPIRVRKDGHWQPVDTTLVESDGVLRPKVAQADIAFSNGGGEPLAQLSQERGRRFGVRWHKPLPKPEVHGNVATYRDVVPGGDLVATALPTGMTHDVVLRERPNGPVEIRLPLALTGMRFEKDAARRLLLTDASGDLIAGAPEPQMWDAAAQDSPDAGQRSPVTTRVERDKSGPVLVLEPDADFLADPQVRYPVTIDPWTSLALQTDTFVSTDYTTAQNSATWLHAGKFGSGAKTARTYLQFGATRLVGSKIKNADLRMWNYKSNTCGTSVGSGIQVRRVTSSWKPSTLKLDAQPSTTAANAVTNTRAAGEPGCKEAEMYYSIEGIVQDWANGAANYGLQLRAANESDATNWRMYRSAENGDSAKAPKLIVDYTPPTRPDGTIPESVATGVASIDGKPVPGADVLALAWPRKDILTDMAEDADVPTYTIGEAKADAQGRFIIDVDPDALPSDYVADDRSVDVELAIADSTREVRWQYTATRPGAAPATMTDDPVTPLWSTASADATDNSGPATLKIDLGGQAYVGESRADSPAEWVDPGPEGEETDPDVEELPDVDPDTVPEWVDDSLGEKAGAAAAAVAVEERSGVFAEAAAASGAFDAPTVAPHIGPVCWTRTLKNLYGRSERFMQVHGWSGAKATVTQRYGANHQLGIGVESSKGKWSGGGSVKVELAASAERGGLTRHWVYNRVNYREYRRICMSDTGATVWSSTYRRPVGMHSLLTKLTKAKPVIFRGGTKCTPYSSGEYMKSRGRNATVNGGMDLGEVKVSAQSGFDSSSSITWNIKKTRLCGNTDSGWSAKESRMAEAHKY